MVFWRLGYSCWKAGATKLPRGAWNGLATCTPAGNQKLRYLDGAAGAEEEVLEAVDEGEVGGGDDVFGDADGVPGVGAGAGFDEDAGFGACAGLAVEDADFVVFEDEFAQFGVDILEGFAEGFVEGVDGAVAFCGGVHARGVGEDEFDGGFGEACGTEDIVCRGIGPTAGDADVESVQFKEFGVVGFGAADEEFEGGVRALEFVALTFEGLDLVENAAGGGIVTIEGDAKFAGFFEKTRTTGHFADGNAGDVADEGGVDVFVAGLEFADGVGVHAAFVGEGVASGEGGGVIGHDIGEFGDEIAEMGELAELLGADHVVAHLELDGGDDGAEVCIAGAFAVAVDGALDLCCAFEHGLNGVGDAAAAVVVGVDAEGRVGEALFDGGHRLGDFPGEAAAVGVAEDDDFRACVAGGLHGGEGVFAVFEVAVEEVLAIEENAAPLAAQVGYGVVDDLEVVFETDAQDFADLSGGRLGEDGDDGGVGAEERGHVGVVFNGGIGVAGAAEGAHDGVLKVDVAGALEELGGFGIGAGLAAFNIGDAEVVEGADHADLIFGGEFDAWALCAVAEGYVVDVDFFCGHWVKFQRQFNRKDRREHKERLGRANFIEFRGIESSPSLIDTRGGSVPRISLLRLR